MITYLYTQQANNLVDDSLNSVFYEPWQTKCWEAWQHKRRKSNLTLAWEVRKASQWRWPSKPRSIMKAGVAIRSICLHAPSYVDLILLTMEAL